MVICAQAVVAILTAITVAGFMKQIEANSGGDDDDDDADDAATSGVNGSAEAEAADDDSTLGQLHEFLAGKSSQAARVFEYSIASLIVLNIVAVVLESIDEERTARVGAVSGDRMIHKTVYDVFELVSIVVFTVEYVLRLAAAPKASIADEGYETRLGYLCSFFGIVDFMTIAPYYVQVILHRFGVSFDAAPFRVFRVFRIFQLDRLCGAFSVMGQALRACQDTMIAFGLVALIIWVGAASLYYVFEKHNDLPQLREAFSSIPSSMYYVSIFLGGEWGETDFTLGGKFVCIALVAIGIELYAISISVLFDAFQDVLDDGDDDDDDDDDDDNGDEPPALKISGGSE